MARTKASVGAKLSSGKSSKAVKVSAPSHSGSSTPSTSRGSSGSGNPYHPRPTPKWQKPITNFFGNPPNLTNSDDEEIVGSSMNGRPRHSRQINSDTESDIEDLNASNNNNNNNNGDDDLPPLSPDETSHKINEYFEKTRNKPAESSHSIKGKGKGKGKGKKSIECADGNLNNSYSINDSDDDNRMEVDSNKENLTMSNVISHDDEEMRVVKAEKRLSNFDGVEENIMSSKRAKISI